MLISTIPPNVTVKSTVLMVRVQLLFTSAKVTVIAAQPYIHGCTLSSCLLCLSVMSFRWRPYGRLQPCSRFRVVL